MTTRTTDTPRHPRWPHLPAGPWKFTGSGREVYQAVPGDSNCPVQPGGACDHCGTAIFDCYYFTAAGERFKVGSTCVRKMVKQMADDGVARRAYRSLSAAERAVKDAKNARARERAAERNAKRRAAAAIKRTRDAVILSDMLADPRTVAAAQAAPHPSIPGKTLMDYVTWCQDNGANPGKLVAALKAARA